MRRQPRAASLRREIVLWYSVVLLVALSVFAGLTYLILRQTLERAGTLSLQQTARTAEQLVIPPNVPRIAVREDRVRPEGGGVETLRRSIRLATGDVVDIYVARPEDVEQRALQSFLLISLMLIPLTAGAAAVGGRRVADRLLRPLDRLVDATRRIGIGALSEQVEEPDRPAELRELAASFNGMLKRLDAAVSALRQFTADASHELRTPLTAIRGTAQVALARDRSNSELRATLAEMVEETEWMLQLVEGLLTLARGEESGGAEETVDLTALLTDARETAEILATGKEVAVRLERVEPAVVRARGGALRQVFLNLVSNAVKFTEQGEVVISINDATAPPPAKPDRSDAAPEAPSPGDGRKGVEVVVRDTGRGIPEDELPRVFDRFYRGDSARAPSGGTGLGLAIARAIVEQHGGRITAESRLGEGSTFRVWLPKE